MTRQSDQVGALCYRRTGNKSLRILLVTSRETRRWVIPKGWHEKGAKGHQSAAQEALEEAGAIGRVSTRSIGLFHYLKQEEKGDLDLCVAVYLLQVKRLRSDWKERKERTRKWFSVTAAAKKVDEPELAALVRNLADHLKD